MRIRRARHAIRSVHLPSGPGLSSVAPPDSLSSMDGVDKASPATRVLSRITNGIRGLFVCAGPLAVDALHGPLIATSHLDCG